ncbi:MAG: amino acid ABC transporter permease [Hyphomicrobiales bacterium]
MELAIESLPYLWQGLLITLAVSALTVVSSLIIGVLLGTLVVYGPPPVRWLIVGYSDIIRGIPVIVLIFSVYYGLPPLGINLGNFPSAVVALTAFASAQVTEIARGALQSIHFGQVEAGKAIGLGFWPRMFYVVFPQALRRFLPPWINNVTDTVKGSALVSLVGVIDLMLSIQQVIGRVYEPMPLYIVGSLIYFAINFSLSQLSRRLEMRFAYIRE